MSSQNDPSFVRYLQARLVPLARPMFWAPIGLVGLAGFVLWQFKEHPEWWTTTVEQPVGTQSRAISDPTFPIRDPIPDQGLAINPLNTELQPFVQPTEQMPTIDANSLIGKKTNSAPEEGSLGQSLKQSESQSSSDNGLSSDPIAAFFQPNYKSAFKGNNPTSKAPEPVKPIGQVTLGSELQKFRPVPSGENPLSKAVDQVFSNNSASEVTTPKTTGIESQPSLPQVQSVPRIQNNQPNSNPYAVQTPPATQPQYNQPYINPYTVQTPSATQPQYNQPYPNPYAPQTPPATQPYSNPYAPQTPSATQPQYNQPYSNPDFDRTPSMQPTLRVR